MNQLPSLSIFFPAFNEAENIPIIVAQVLENISKITDQYEIIIVNDGSTDNTTEVVNSLILKNKNIKMITHPTNLGYGAALKTGFYNSRFEYIVYMDSDGQFDFLEIYKLIPFKEEFQIVIGYRIKRADNFLRKLNGHLWTFLMNLLLGIGFKDIDCGFKLIKKEVIDRIPKLESNGATISAELLAKAKKYGFKIKQVGLTHKSRLYGKATGGNVLHIFRAFYDLLKILKKI